MLIERIMNITEITNNLIANPMPIIIYDRLVNIHVNFSIFEHITTNLR